MPCVKGVVEDSAAPLATPGGLPLARKFGLPSVMATGSESSGDCCVVSTKSLLPVNKKNKKNTRMERFHTLVLAGERVTAKSGESARGEGPVAENKG